jgi:Domain of unknown function (DUF4386)
MSIGRLAGLFYLGTFVSGLLALAVGAGMAVANAVATICYVGVTVLFYLLFRRVNQPVAAIAALFSTAGCIASALRAFKITPPINELGLFGCYCILTGYLITRSTFLPRWLGVLLSIGGVSWLTFAYAPLGRALSPYNYGPGILAEGLLTIWLLVYGARESGSARG